MLYNKYVIVFLNDTIQAPQLDDSGRSYYTIFNSSIILLLQEITTDR